MRSPPAQEARRPVRLRVVLVGLVWGRAFPPPVIREDADNSPMGLRNGHLSEATGLQWCARYIACADPRIVQLKKGARELGALLIGECSGLEVSVQAIRRQPN